MKVTMLVDVCKPLQNLMAPASDPRLWHKGSPVFHQLVQVAVLHREQQLSLCSLTNLNCHVRVLSMSLRTLSRNKERILQ